MIRHRSLAPAGVWRRAFFAFGLLVFAAGTQGCMTEAVLSLARPKVLDSPQRAIKKLDGSLEIEMIREEVSTVDLMGVDSFSNRRAVAIRLPPECLRDAVREARNRGSLRWSESPCAVESPLDPRDNQGEQAFDPNEPVPFEYDRTLVPLRLETPPPRTETRYVWFSALPAALVADALWVIPVAIIGNLLIPFGLGPAGPPSAPWTDASKTLPNEPATKASVPTP